MFRVEEMHWWYGALQRLIFQALEAELPYWRKKKFSISAAARRRS